MIIDRELIHAIDYSEGQKEAAYMVLGELVNLLNEFADDIRVIGGWVPSLLYPESGHIGSIDVDILLNQQEIENIDGYMTIKRILLKNGYTRDPKKYFTFVKRVYVLGIPYDVDVDFLCGKYGGTGGKVSKHVGGLKALPATGGNFAFDFPPHDVKIEYRRMDGALDVGHVKVVSDVPYLVMKAEALGRGKPKDAYDIYITLKNYPGGVRSLASAFIPYKDRMLVKNMCWKLSEKFASPEHAGPMDIVAFQDIRDAEDYELIKQDAYQLVSYLVNSLT